MNSKILNNMDLWNYLRDAYPNFKSHTAKATADFFSEAGFERLRNYDASVLSDFYGLSLRVYLQAVTTSHAKDPLADAGFGEAYDQPLGGIIQRISVNSIKPVSPVYKGLKDGDSIDPFIVRKPTSSERFFKQNFDYQSLITVPDDFQMKQIFISEYGMSEYMAGIMEGLQNGYTIQVYNNKLEALNAALNSTTNPLQESQKIHVTLSENTTDSEWAAFQLEIMNTLTAISIVPQSSKFNAAKFATTQDRSRLKLLVRAGYKNDMKVKLLANTFNRDDLAIDVDIIEVPNFGGLQPFKEAGFSTPLYPAYNALGEQIGYNTAPGQSKATVTEDKVFWKDPNIETVAVLADKGVVFETKQNAYTVEAIRNPRGLYTNYWASCPNGCIVYDANYTLVEFTTGA